MALLPTRVHGVLDYAVGGLLAASPWLLGFDKKGGPARWLPVSLGVGALAYSLLTDYEHGVTKSIPMETHLKLDKASGVLLAASPWLFGFARRVWAPHLVFGLFEVAAAMLTEPRPEGSPQVANRAAQYRVRPPQAAD